MKVVFTVHARFQDLGALHDAHVLAGELGDALSRSRSAYRESRRSRTSRTFVARDVSDDPAHQNETLAATPGTSLAQAPPSPPSFRS